jgi:hypothetical protein
MARPALAAPLLALALLSSCADPEAAFDAFAERYRRTHPGGDSGTGGVGGACALPVPDDLAGPYLLVISPAFSPKTPILLLDELSAELAGTNHITLGMTLTALSAADRKTPVGAPLPSVSAELPPGAFSFDLGVLQIAGEADPIIPGAPITGSVILDGELCADATDFMCGDVRGQVTAPAELDLLGSTWTLSRRPSPTELPDIVINCAMEAPDPL